MSTLTFMPSPAGSAEELIAKVRAMEREAARRYRGLAAQMRLCDEAQLAELFELLATPRAQQHAAAEAARPAPGNPLAAPDPDDEAPDRLEADAEQDDSRPLTAYRALAGAVRAEERAFAFYSYLAAAAPNEQVRKLAEALATEELARAGLLRRERRKAYRAQPAADRQPAPPPPRSVADLLRLCLETETRAARYHRLLAASLAGQAGAATAFLGAAEDEEGCAREAAARIDGDIPEAVDAPTPPTFDGGLRLLDEAFEGYSEIAGQSADEGVLQEAQLLAARALRRLQRAHLALQAAATEATAGS